MTIVTPARVVLVFLGGLLAACLETGLVAAVPGPLRFLPFVLAVGVYLTQSRSLPAGPWLIAGFGLFLDGFGLASVPFQTGAYALAAVAAAVSSRELFSNRSLSGLLGCGLLAWATHALVQTAVWFVAGLDDPMQPPWGDYAWWLVWRLALLSLSLAVLYYAVPRRTRLSMQR